MTEMHGAGSGETDSSPAQFTFAALDPVSFLDRAAAMFAERTAVVDGPRTLTYRELHHRAAQLTTALAASGIEPGDRVAALCSNSHLMLEMHYGVPMRGAVLVPVNIRLSAEEMRYILTHSGARLLVATDENASLAQELAGSLGIPVITEAAYHDWLSAQPARAEHRVATDERELLALNYTSGTTGTPKGVMYHRRGAYLQAVAMAYHAGLTPASRYLWTLPMFHCNGWCFTWAVTAAGATHVCLRSVDTAKIWALLNDNGVTHFSAAPTVLTMIGNDPHARPLPRRVKVDTGGAPPSPTLLGRMSHLGFDITHLYGLTETFGPVAVNIWQSEWDDLEPGVRDELNARQGGPNIIAQPVRVLDDNGRDVPADGATIGELVIRGNDVMLGYYRDPDATAAVTVDGFFRTGDLAVMHPDGYCEIRDRKKDIIVTGGENVASVEVERALDSHPDVLESAVVGDPDPQWGEVIHAYVTMKAGYTTTEADLTAHVRRHLGGFKIPRRFTFTELPRTSTGKIRKNVLREQRPAADS